MTILYYMKIIGVFDPSTYAKNQWFEQRVFEASPFEDILSGLDMIGRSIAIN